MALLFYLLMLKYRKHILFYILFFKYLLIFGGFSSCFLGYTAKCPQLRYVPNYVTDSTLT